MPLLFSWRSDSNNYCGNYQRREISEILTFDVYKETAVVKLASFKFNFESANLPKINDQVDMDGFYELTTLSDAEAKHVMDVLVNYDFSAEPTQQDTGADSSTVAEGEVTVIIEEVTRDEFFCYSPRNAILFFDEKGDVIGYVELCFECLGSRSHPVSLRVGEFCNEKFGIIKEIFLRNAIRYGVAVSDDAWPPSDEDAESGKFKRDVFGEVATAREYIEEGEFLKANERLVTAIQLDGTNRYAHFLYGHSLLKMRKYEKARSEFDQVIKLDPGFRQAYYERALAMIELSQETRPQRMPLSICSDLRMAQTLGDESVSMLKRKYCK